MPKKYTHKNWSKKEETKLRVEYKIKSNKDISTLLNRPIKSISCKANRLGLMGRGKPRKFLHEDVYVHVKEKDWFYIGGLFDGEGTIARRGGKGLLGFHPRVTITDKEIVDYLQNTLKHGQVYSYPPRKTQTRTVYSWCVSDINGIYWLLFHLQNFLRLNRKRELAEKVVRKVEAYYSH